MIVIVFLHIALVSRIGIDDNNVVKKLSFLKQKNKITKNRLINRKKILQFVEIEKEIFP